MFADTGKQLRHLHQHRAPLPEPGGLCPPPCGTQAPGVPQWHPQPRLQPHRACMERVHAQGAPPPHHLHHITLLSQIESKLLLCSKLCEYFPSSSLVPLINVTSTFSLFAGRFQAEHDTSEASTSPRATTPGGVHAQLCHPHDGPSLRRF